MNLANHTAPELELVNNFCCDPMDQTLITKSIKTEKDGTIIAEVGGVISDESKDSEGDTIVQKSLDFSYIEKGFGRIKYEHGDYNEKGTLTNLNEPQRFIGVIDRVIRKGRKTEFEGRIIAKPGTSQYTLAKAVIDDMINLQTANAAAPAKRMMKSGWSVEGGVVKDSKTNRLKGVINHVVYTAKPVNTNSFATLLKSLSVGYGYGIGEKTGGGALRKESIDHSPKYNTIGDSKMKFNSEDHAYRHCLSKSVDGNKEEAKKKAKELWQAQMQEAEEEKNGMEQHAGEGAEAIHKSQKILQGMFKGIEDINDPMEAQNRILMKSIKPQANGEIDLGIFLKSMGEIQIGYGVNQVAIAKSLEGLLTGVEKVLELNKSLSAKVVSLESNVAQLADENFTLRKSIAMTDRGAISLDGSEKEFDNGGSVKVRTLTKSLAMHGLRQLVKSNKATQRDLANLEGDSLSQDKANMILRAYNDGTIQLPANYQA